MTMKAGHEIQNANFGQQKVKNHLETIEENGIKWELVPPNKHWRNVAGKAS